MSLPGVRTAGVAVGVAVHGRPEEERLHGGEGEEGAVHRGLPGVIRLLQVEVGSLESQANAELLVSLRGGSSYTSIPDFFFQTGVRDHHNTQDIVRCTKMV